MLHSAKKLCTPRWIAADWFLSGRGITYEAYVHADGKRQDSHNRPRHFFSPKLTPVYCCQYLCKKKRSNYIVLHNFYSNQDQMHFLPLLVRKKIQGTAMAFFLPLDQRNKKPLNCQVKQSGISWTEQVLLPSYHISLFYSMDMYQHLQVGWICSYVEEKQQLIWRY